MTTKQFKPYRYRTDTVKAVQYQPGTKIKGLTLTPVKNGKAASGSGAET